MRCRGGVHLRRGRIVTVCRTWSSAFDEKGTGYTAVLHRLRDLSVYEVVNQSRTLLQTRSQALEEHQFNATLLIILTTTARRYFRKSDSTETR